MRGESFGGITFLHNIKPSSFGGTKKLYWRRVLEGLYKGSFYSAVKKLTFLKKLILILMFDSFLNC